MGFPNRRRQKQVRLTVFDNEPMARLAEQRLWQSGIPCFTRSLRGGPGLWGSSYNLPHDLYVYEADQGRAREVLDLAEPTEGEELTVAPRHGLGIWLAVAIIAAALAAGIIIPLISGLPE